MTLTPVYSPGRLPAGNPQELPPSRAKPSSQDSVWTAHRTLCHNVGAEASLFISEQAPCSLWLWREFHSGKLGSEYACGRFTNHLRTAGRTGASIFHTRQEAQGTDTDVTLHWSGEATFPSKFIKTPRLFNWGGGGGEPHLLLTRPRRRGRSWKQPSPRPEPQRRTW